MSRDNSQGFGSGTSLDAKRLRTLYTAIQKTYCADNRPWVIGYSGGKDSTATLQLIWYALTLLPKEQLTKPIYVIASDTLVESPIIVGHIKDSLDNINAAAKKQGLPLTAQLVYPAPEETFWVNMIGKGYPAPYKRFRWCTERLKIDPANRFIKDKVAKHGEVILVLGVRRAESASRAQVMSLHKRFDEYLSRHSQIANAWVFTPVEDWSLDDVWDYLLNSPCPWGGQNRNLVTLYRNAQGGECPLVVDTSTPSCGSSRFGCWVCTVVEKDKSMEAMIDNGEEWMQPLLDLRDWLADTQDQRRSTYIVMSEGEPVSADLGRNNDKLIWGPYKFEVRKTILRRLLEIQKQIQDEESTDLELISAGELHEIRRLWKVEAGDWEDSVPKIFREIFGRDLAWKQNDEAIFDEESAELLNQVCEKYGLPPSMVRGLIGVEQEMSGMARRAGIFDRIENMLEKDWRSEQEVFDALNLRFELQEDEIDEEAENAI